MTPPINSVSDERLDEILRDDLHDRVMSPRAKSDIADALTELAARRAANTPVDGVDALEVAGWTDKLLTALAAKDPWDYADQTQARGLLMSFKGILAAALSASPALPSQMADWRCEKCGGRSFARCDERKPDGTFAHGQHVRCVNCKDVSLYPCLTSPAAEPFGWWVSDNASEAYMTFERDEHTRRTRMRMRHGDWTEIALYTHPSASREVTDEMVERGCRADIDGGKAYHWLVGEDLEVTDMHRMVVRSIISAALLAALPEREG